MRLGRVVGRVVATVRAPDLDGEKLLVVQPLDALRRNAGATVVACDVAQSGLGDLVIWVGGREAALALPRTFVPVDATIVGHVESAASSGLGEPAASSGLGEPASGGLGER
jgi:ethanolamine utilization protein EutN